MIRPDWNAEEVRAYVSGLTDRALSRRLDIVQDQIQLAYEAQDTITLTRLREHERIIIDERATRLGDG